MADSQQHGIFISYRREDSSAYAGRLYDHLVARFGADRVFIDVDSINPGLDFVSAVEAALDRCDAVLAMIGPRWLTATEASGQRRLDLPDDWVRIEIETALAQSRRLIPVLVHGAPMPPESELPSSLAALSRHQAVQLGDRHWRSDVGTLVNLLERPSAKKVGRAMSPRVITFLSVDQVRPKAQLGASDGAATERTHQALFDILQEAFDNHRGKAVNSVGSGSTATFESPGDAVSCAIAIQQSVQQHNDRRATEEVFGVRVGIHSGEAVTNDELGYFGTAVLKASQLREIATPGQILVSDVVRALAEPRQSHTFQSVDLADLRLLEPPIAYEAEWAPTERELAVPPALLRFEDVGFVGRLWELTWLMEIWRFALSGKRQAVFLSGGPGIGKSRLAAQFAQLVKNPDSFVFYANFREHSPSRYEALAEAFANYVAVTPRYELRSLVANHGAELTSVLPWLRERIPDLAPADIATEEVELSVAAKAVEDFTVNVANTMPSLLILDDLQWARRPMLAVVRQLLHGTARARLLVLLLSRNPTESPSSLGNFERSSSAHRHSLTGLSLVEGEQLLTSISGDAVSTSLRETVVAGAGGNPSLLCEAGRDLVQKRLTEQVSNAVRRAERVKVDLRGAHEEIASGVLQIQRLRDREADEVIAAPADAVDPPNTPPLPIACPYKGLACFEAPDAEFFFGRERLVAQLMARLVAARFVGVIGPSGSGKSSLVRGGLLPTLAADGLPGSKSWLSLVMTPGSDPLTSLADRLAQLRARESHDRLLDQLRNEPRALDGIVSELVSGGPDAARLVVVVDQFEELFTACRDEAERRRFIDALLHAAQAPYGRTVVVIAVRADFYGHVASYTNLAAELAETQVVVGPMTSEELRRAIVEPARRAGLVLEPGLSDIICEDVVAQPGALPLMSTALLQTWERRRGKTLTLAGYGETGGVHGAVARLADSAYQSLDTRQQGIARSIFLRLIEPGEGVTEVRRRTPVSELGADDEAVAGTLDVLVRRRLVVAGEGTVEVTHEALLREWPSLRRWLDEDREGRRLHHQLAEAAAGWVQVGRDRELLFRGARLGAALEWGRTHTDDLNSVEREFLNASRDEHDAQLRRARRSARRLRALAVGLTGALVVALAAGGFATVQRASAQHHAAVATAASLAGLAQYHVSGRGDVDLLLAVESHRLADSITTRGALVSALNFEPRLTSLSQSYGRHIASFDVSPDGSALALGYPDGTFRLWDPARHRPRSTAIRANRGPSQVLFSPDGRTLATFGAVDRTVRLWDAARGSPMSGRWSPKQGASRLGAFSPDGTRLATTGDSDGTVRFWDVPSGAAAGVAVPSGVGPASPVAFTRDGAGVIVAAGAHDAMMYDVGTGRPIGQPFSGLGGRLAALDLSPDGSLLATVSRTGGVLLWDVATRRQKGRRIANDDGIARSVRFSPDGRNLVIEAQNGKLNLWDIRLDEYATPVLEVPSGLLGVGFEDRTSLVAVSSDEVATLDLNALTLAHRISDVGGAVQSVKVSRDGRLVATALRDGGTVRLWSASRRRPVRDLTVPDAEMTYDVAFSPDGRYLVAAMRQRDSGETDLVLWDLNADRQVNRIPTQISQVTRLDYSKDGKTIAAGTGDGRVVLWQAPDLRPHGAPLVVDALHRRVSAVAFSPDGKTLAVGGEDAVVSLWDWDRGAKRRALSGVASTAITSLAYSPDGTTLASGDADGKVVSWSLRGRPRLPETLNFVQHGAINDVGFSSDGNTLEAQTSTGSIHLWDVPHDKAIVKQIVGVIGPPVKGCENIVCPTSAQFVGTALVTGGWDGSLAFWDLRPSSLETKACALAGRNLSRSEWKQFVGGSYRRTCSQWPTNRG